MYKERGFKSDKLTESYFRDKTIVISVFQKPKCFNPNSQLMYKSKIFSEAQVVVFPGTCLSCAVTYSKSHFLEFVHGRKLFHAI